MKPTAAMDVLAVIGRRLREAERLLGVRPRGSPNEVVEERMTMLQRIADTAADFSGRFRFWLVHAAWFAVWIGLNVRLFPGEPFDPFPFGLLAMIVSIEAIFLSCMLLTSQNRSPEKQRIRCDVEYEAHIRAGLEVTQLHVKVDAMSDRLLARLVTPEKQLGQRTTAGRAQPIDRRSHPRPRRPLFPAVSIGSQVGRRSPCRP